jgi:tetratricopeptide (TPR) repeat protein
LRNLELKSNDPVLWKNKGVALYSLKRYYDSLGSFDKALELNPAHDDAWNNKGGVIYALGGFEESLIYFDKATSLKSDHADAWYNKGLANTALENYDEAVKCFDKAIQLKASLDWASLSKGIANYNRGYYIEALEDFKKVEDAEIDGIKHNNIGLCCFQLGLYEDAEGHYRQAISSKEASQEVYYNLAVLYTKQNKLELAENILKNDQKSKYSKEAYKKVKRSNITEQADWYEWWFSGKGIKKALGIFLLVAILSLIVITAIIALTGKDLSTPSKGVDSGLMDFLNIDIAKATGLVIMIVLLIAILLLSSLKTIKVGEVQLDTDQLNEKKLNWNQIYLIHHQKIFV